MKTRRTTLRIALIAAAAMVSASSLAKDADREAALRAAELRRFEANVNADAKVLGELLDEGLEYVHSNGALDSKQSFIESLTSGRRDYASTVADIESTRILGDVAIIRGKARVTVIEAGKPLDLHIGYTDTWLWKNNHWQMTAWRSARLPAAPRGDEASARAAVLARFDAALRADSTALEQLLADELDYCSFRGTCETKRQYIDSIKSGLLKYRSIEPTIESVKMFTDSAAVLGRVSVTATRDGLERSIRISYLGLLAWRDGRWQMTAWTSTLLDEAAK